MNIRRLSTIRIIAAAALAVTLAVTLAACGGGDDDDDGGNPTTAASAAPTSDGANPTAAASAAPTSDGGNGVPVSNDLTLVSSNTLFDKSELRATEGEITITHDNQDGGIIHNVAVFKGSDATGELMGATDLEAGPVTQTLVLNLEPGEYYFVCESHPATMYGTLIVEEE